MFFNVNDIAAIRDHIYRHDGKLTFRDVHGAFSHMSTRDIHEIIDYLIQINRVRMDEYTKRLYKN